MCCLIDIHIGWVLGIVILLGIGFWLLYKIRKLKAECKADMRKKQQETEEEED